MKQQFYPILLSLFFLGNLQAQESINELLAAGISDTQRFVKSYLTPASEGLAHSISNGWFNNAKSPRRFGFEISLIGNISFVSEDNSKFNMITSDYENIKFLDNSPSKIVPTVFGQSNSETVILTFDDPNFGGQEIELSLPGGIGSESSSMIPSAFLQASFSPFKGTQVKARIFPKLSMEDSELNAYGFGIQQDLLFWLPGKKVLPFAASGVIAFTHLDGSYEFGNSSIINGTNQQMTIDINSMLYQLVLGTKLKIINFYGAIGLISVKSTTKLLGSYQIVNGTQSSDTITDPISITNNTSGVRTTLGTSLKLGFFGINADYTFADYNSATIGINIGF